MRLPIPTLLLCLAATLGPSRAPRAQGSIVVPPSAAATEATSAASEPFAYDEVRHVHYIHQSLLLGLGLNTLVKEIDYRRDSTASTITTMLRYRTPATKTQPVWQIRLGNYSGSVIAPVGDFPTATTAGWSTVFSAKPVNFPDLPLVGTGAQPFDLKFVFDVPFQFTGPHLGIDHFAYESAVGGFVYLVDAVNYQPNGGSANLITPSSLGCPSGQNRAYGASADPGGGDLVFDLFGAETGRLASACLGTSSNAWGSLPLPLDLTNLLLLPGCKIYCDLAVTLPVVTDGAGAAQLRVPVPADPALANGTLYGQWVVRDSRVNPAVGLATSDGVRFTLGSEVLPQMSVVSAIANLAQGRAGFVQPGQGPVVKIVW